MNMNANAATYDVFLSHNSKDKPVVEPLAERLKAEGLKVWLDAWSLVPLLPNYRTHLVWWNEIVTNSGKTTPVGSPRR
ncbi:MAG: toll/interleukin-1 receptor domain-containing protein [Planctomycetota bacterium]|jgi:hypothetical protein|nr:toll/interleukin-1 receptor domain-containing protein [Planctomycetota bacterium]